MLGLVVQRQDGNSCGALGVAAWSGVHAGTCCKICPIPFRFNFSNLELNFNNNF